MQNLIYQCRQGVKALADKQCKFGCIPVRSEYIIVQSANKILYDSLSDLKSYWNKRISCQRTIIHMKEMSEICKSVKLWRFIKWQFCKVMCNTLHYSIIAGSSEC